MEIAQLSDPRGALHSPSGLIERGRRIAAEQLARVRSAVCPRKDIMNMPEVDLAAVITSALLETAAPSISSGLACAIAVYAAKRGVGWLCPDIEVNPG
ncbi:hypothetical protein [Streptomyces sp. N2A]|uniref:hypothetical protein n=1 Tax=Streptomyces sp. N2A TaxID=3073936 RepID=UPI0028700710|nr:hypothetical protein [Streptomyces sp. N2A]